MDTSLQEMLSWKGRGRRMKDGACHCAFHWKRVSCYLIISLPFAYVITGVSKWPYWTHIRPVSENMFRFTSRLFPRVYRMGSRLPPTTHISHDNHGPRWRIVVHAQPVKCSFGAATLLMYTDVADGGLVCAAARITQDRDRTSGCASIKMKLAWSRVGLSGDFGHWRTLRSLPAAAVAFECGLMGGLSRLLLWAGWRCTVPTGRLHVRM